MSVESTTRDVRLGLRRLMRDWRFTAGAVLILGLGIGANAAIFSVVNAALFRPSLAVNPDRVVEIYQNGADGRPSFSSYPAFTDMTTYTQQFAGLTAASGPRPVNFLEQGSVRRGVAEYATPGYLSVLGLRPALGRWLEPADDRSSTDLVAVLGHETWTRRFGADPSIIGRVIRIEGVPATIVGVGPAGYIGTMNLGVVTDFWLPIAAMPAMLGTPGALERRTISDASFLVKARLNDGVTVAQAQAAMDILAARLARDYPDEDPGRGITVRASTDVRVHPVADAFLAVMASLLLAAVGLVLAIACSNLATLLLVRGTARAKEVSVRLALGATRRQIVTMLLAESTLLSLAGGAVGCILAWWAIRALSGIELPITLDFSLDYQVLVFAVGVSLITGIAVGLAPALKATGVDLVSTLRDDRSSGSPNQRWLTLKNALVVFQVAVSVVLLATTGVFLRLLLDAGNQPAGFAIDGVALLQTDARYAGFTPEAADAAYDELRRRVAAIPGVQAAALTSGEPMQPSGIDVVAEAVQAEPVHVNALWAGPGFFEALNIPIVAGRPIDERDRRGAPLVAVISEGTATRLFGAVNAVGRRVRLEEAQAWIEVVGVARDSGTADPTSDLVDGTRFLFYRSSPQWDMPLRTVLARSSLDAAPLVAAMQRELRAIDPALPVVSAKTMARHIDDSLVLTTAMASFVGALGALGAALAGIGLYAVVAFAVSRRIREIGIRMALGARGEQVAWTVTRETAVLVAAGTVVGVMLSLLTILGLRQVSLSAPGSLYTPVADPIALVIVAVLMVIVGALAACVPAARAARMNPLAALRHD